MAMPPVPTASFGKIDEFDPATDSWDIYCERLHHCFTARNIDENATELKRAILLSEMGKIAYSAAAEAQKGLYLRSYPYRRYNKLILVSF